MDEYDKKILNIIQSGFPLVECPYNEIGKMVGLDEDEVWQRVRQLRKNGVIRRIGANFQSKKLGYVSTLCATHVPEEKLDKTIEVINSFPGVTHNYLRTHKYNLWFTIIGKNNEVIRENISTMEKLAEIKILNLPASKLFKIKVNFMM